MKYVSHQAGWPESWTMSSKFDRIELLGITGKSELGYLYAYRSRRHAVLELIQRLVPGGGKILDVAAGQGNLTLTLAELGFEVTWNDIREDLAAYVELKYERGVVHFAPGDITELSLDPSFDIVLATEVIEHVAHPDPIPKSLDSVF